MDYLLVVNGAGTGKPILVPQRPRFALREARASQTLDGAWVPIARAILVLEFGGNWPLALLCSCSLNKIIGPIG